MPLHGERLSKPTYAILRSLRGGNVGEAWVGFHEIFERQVVQKRYSTIGLEDAVAHGEPRLMRDITHAHVAEVLEAQFDPEMSHAITFVMPYYEGGSIADAFDEGYVFSIHRALKLTMQMLDALAHVHHHHRYIHRDMKPGNVFLDSDRDHAYVGDWGSAAIMDASGDVAAIDGSLLYTPPEAGPEDGAMGVTGDIYATGLTLYEMLNGPFPYAEISPETAERRVAGGRRALPDGAFEHWDPCVPADLRTVVRKAIRARPSDRYQSCAELRRRLARVRCIDWKRVDGRGDDLGGAWTGTWPPHLREPQRRRYRVASRVLRTGYRALEATEARPGSTWRRFGLDDARLRPDDRAAVERFFAEVATKAAQRVAAR
jgi:eukaryotic-like serine/threonine-protein kinase